MDPALLVLTLQLVRMWLILLLLNAMLLLMVLQFDVLLLVLHGGEVLGAAVVRHGIHVLLLIERRTGRHLLLLRLIVLLLVLVDQRGVCARPGHQHSTIVISSCRCSGRKHLILLNLSRLQLLLPTDSAASGSHRRETVGASAVT